MNTTFVNYTSKLSPFVTQEAIKKTKDFFEDQLAEVLGLMRVSAPLFVQPEMGLNDNLSGVERPVGFDILDTGQYLEIVHSLAKWKRLVLQAYDVPKGKGIYTDMNAIRRDEVLDNTHSIYVDQWDWEKTIDKEDRNIDFLKKTVRDIYRVFLSLEAYLLSYYPQLEKKLPSEITFITTQELEDRYPDLSSQEREDAITREHKAVFLIGIGDTLKGGEPHDSRAPDYDDWKLNGDILFYNDLLDAAFEISSMGIRVDENSLMEQLEKANALDRKDLYYHRLLREKRLPYTIGGGIGQSRMCMFFLDKVHIGEVQVSFWPREMRKACKKMGIQLL